MSPIQCAQFEQMVEQEAEGALPATAVAHMETCTDCRELWSDLEAIHAAGKEWGSEEVMPPEDLWASLQQRMRSEGLIRTETAARGSWAARWFGAAPRWALAGASISLLLIAGMLASYQSSESRGNEAALPVHLSRASATKLVASDLGRTLDGDLQRVFDSLPEGNPLLASSLRENLGIVDNLIAVCEKSVREQPNDAVARDYLYGAYQQKAVLLATAMDRSASEGQ